MLWCKGKVRLYDLIRDGTKTSDWREDTEFWRKRLLDKQPKTAWFMEGYPKNNVPRLEADIIEAIIHRDLCLIEIKFYNVREVV